MLYITVALNPPPVGHKSTRDETWHVGEPNPFQANMGDIHRVIEVQADGDELTYIAIHMGQAWRPQNNALVVRWYGDMAKFIAGNLPHKFK